MSRPSVLATSIAALALGGAILDAFLFPIFAQVKVGNHHGRTSAQRAIARRHNETLRKADESIRFHDYRAAEALYATLRGESPDDPDITMRIARLYDLQGRDREALEQYRRAFEGQGGFSRSVEPDFLARYGELLTRFGDEARAREAYREAAATRDRLKAAQEEAAQAQAAEERARNPLGSPNDWEAGFYASFARVPSATMPKAITEIRRTQPVRPRFAAEGPVTLTSIRG